ncbi:LuxR C-terminal-related transcriptional regulator [Cellulomonas dongxiuzhuiae]|uniref:LuxR C-terminal-related transcriptional regulator n=1 Tax=Cellulomonas dongxiuzhuiae TaxID=2819979 RepID=UPI001AAF8329|nr:LuxR C-terminal-related transcriptional regulator [Cellulomonas dongxiuzhuiae]MBO3087119.1 response regulator transcription factor [Cellulomonas dongxiuzhuiae]
MSPRIAQRFSTFLVERRAQPPSPFPTHTSREGGVLRLVARGADNIARRLSVGPKTVCSYISSISAKLYADVGGGGRDGPGRGAR